MKPLYIIHMNQTPIFRQLQLEEALLRTDDRNFLILNSGSPRSIVMGLSGDPLALLNLDRVRRDSVPVIKRYSGGGTVVIDENTLFVSMIFSKDSGPFSLFPEPIMQWSYLLYKNAWKLPDFSLIDNDYVINQRKCGGNALYIRKNRWLHHTSFLWDYSEENMNYLLLPPKQPAYRQSRGHTDFLCRLKEYAPSLNELIEQLNQELVKRFYICQISVEELNAIQGREHRQTTHFIQEGQRNPSKPALSLPER
jgi:lipoate-protein ligase A